VTNSGKKPRRPIDVFVAKTEEILQRRRDEKKDERDRRNLIQDPSVEKALPKWTYEELYYAYPPFRDMRRGRHMRPSVRSDVEYVADLLLCSLDERNEMLIAAEYAPHAPYIGGTMLDYALEVGRRIADSIQGPAFVVTRDYNMHYWNKYALLPFNTSQEEEDRERPLPQDRNILRYIFDPTTPVYQVFSSSSGDSQWHEYTRRLNVWRFKLDNFLCRYDEWYLDRVESLMSFSDFEQIWSDIQIDTGVEKISKQMPTGMLVPEYVTTIYRPDGREFRVRGLQIDYTGWGYPRIMVYTHDNEDARQIFEELGIPASDNGVRYL
jgi:hypothetical protein